MGVKEDEAKVGKVYKTEAGASKLLERLPNGGYGIEATDGGYTVKKLINDVKPSVNPGADGAIVSGTEDPKARMERIKQGFFDNPQPVNVVNKAKEVEPVVNNRELFKPKTLVNPDSYDPNSKFLSQRQVDKIVVSTRVNEDVKRHNFGTEVPRITREDVSKANADVIEKAKKGDAVREKVEIGANHPMNKHLKSLDDKAKAAEYEANRPRTMDEIISGTKHNMPTNPDATMKNSGVFSDDASKYNLKNVAELEAKVGLEQSRIDTAQVDNTSMFKAVTTKVGSWFGAKPTTELVDKEYNIESPLFKDGALKGNNSVVEGDDVNKATQLGNVKETLKNAKETIMKEMYEPSKEGSSVHFEKGLEKKLNNMDIMEGQAHFGEESKNYQNLTGLGINKDTKLNWQKTESGALEATYKNVIEATADSEKITERRKLQVNFGDDGSISGIDAMKKSGDSWEKVDMDTIKIEGRGYVNPEKAAEIANKTTKEMKKEILSGEGYKDTPKWNLLKRVANNSSAKEEAKSAIDSAKEGLKVHNEALGKMKENIGKTIGDTGRVDMKAIEKAASGTVENVAKDAKNISAMANNTGKGMKSLVMLGAVAAGLGAIKAGFDNSAEQRRQKQLELMSLRQQYGGASSM